MKLPGTEWLQGSSRDHKTISWLLFRVFKLLSQYHSNNTKTVVTLLPQMEGTNPSYFLKIIGNNSNGNAGIRILISKPCTQAFHPKATLPLISQNKTSSVCANSFCRGHVLTGAQISLWWEASQRSGHRPAQRHTRWSQTFIPSFPDHFSGYRILGTSFAIPVKVGIAIIPNIESCEV